MEKLPQVSHRWEACSDLNVVVMSLRNQFVFVSLFLFLFFLPAFVVCVFVAVVRFISPASARERQKRWKDLSREEMNI